MRPTIILVLFGLSDLFYFFYTFYVLSDYICLNIFYEFPLKENILVFTYPSIGSLVMGAKVQRVNVPED